MCFALDEWMLRLYPDLRFESREYGDAAGPVRDLIWSVAEQVLASGVDVVPDWNSWSRERRQWAVERAGAVGASVTLHKLTASVDTASEQARARAERETAFAHLITSEGNAHLATLMEEPSDSEGLIVVEHEKEAT